MVQAAAAPADVTADAAPLRPAAAPELGQAPPAERLLSLDVFRGVTIAGMLLVNNPGSWGAIYPPLRHAEWHGWTPTDLIFPFFLFIVGVAMTFSIATQLGRGAAPSSVLLKAAKRAAILFGLGLVLHGFPGYDLSTIRIPGVLQRIAIAYLAATPIVLFARWRGQAATAGALLLLYWAAMMLVPVPGFGAGVLEPGKDLGAWIDRAVFGTAHLWSSARTWDPEGLLSTVPAIGTVLAGVLAGHWIRARRSPMERAVGLFVAGNVGLVLGLVWHQAFPINKPLWTSSYVIFTAGMACHFLAMCYWAVDIRGWKRWATPFVAFGTNAIAAFFLSGLLARILGSAAILSLPDPAGGDALAVKTWLYRQAFLPLFDREVDASLAYAVAYVLVWTAIMLLLYRRRIFVKI